MKSKKKKLVVEGDLNSQVTSTLNENTDLLNEEEVVKNIGALIGMEYKVIDRNFVGVVGSWSGMSYKILFGDFNVVRSQDEHLGSFFDVIKANSFNDFIARVGVFDFPLGRKRFTKFDKNGRVQILDEILIANEVIRMASIENLKLLQFKVDFEKAFDSVNWNFLLDIIRQMGFSLNRIRGFLLDLLNRRSNLIMIKWFTTSKEFKAWEIGLRSEIPFRLLSSLLWWWLFKSILESCDKGFYKGVYLAKNKSNTSLLKYADDALFFGDWSRLSTSNVIYILKCFELASRQHHKE
ncbi:hypothetical protein Tco_0905928 [Tanacetum coccineum]